MKQVMEMSEYTSFIVYKHTSPSGKVYIGITQQTPSRRFNSNGYGYKDNEYFYQAIKKYGWNNFKHEILYSGLSKEIACETEIELIAKYNSANRKYGYNISLGGEHSTPSEETRNKISESLKGHVLSEDHRRKIGEASKGRIHSEETRRRIGEANKISHKGKILSEDHRRKISASGGGHPVMCIETGIVYASAGDVEKRTGIPRGNVSRACKGKSKIAGGLHWKYIIKEE